MFYEPYVVDEIPKKAQAYGDDFLELELMYNRIEHMTGFHLGKKRDPDIIF